MADKYLLRVTAGPTYDPATHTLVAVNTSSPTRISTSLCTASIRVRVQNYRGLPATSPASSSYFSTSAAHQHATYSISTYFTPVGADIPGPALVFGNDFDHPVRDRLPPGVGAGMRILKWVVDPGIEGDVYADRPWLYGGVLSSWDRLRVGGVVVGGDDDDGGGVEDDEEEEKDVGVEEGGQDGGEEVRRRIGVPDEAGERKRFFLEKGKREEWVWEKGRGYWGDFFNGFFDFNEFKVKLPGFSLSILPYLGGDDFLRYVLKNKDTDDVYFVVVFSLVPREEVEKEEAEEASKQLENEKNQRKDEKKAPDIFEPKADDLD